MDKQGGTGLAWEVMMVVGWLAMCCMKALEAEKQSSCQQVCEFKGSRIRKLS